MFTLFMKFFELFANCIKLKPNLNIYENSYRHMLSARIKVVTHIAFNCSKISGRKENNFATIKKTH